MSRKIIGIDIQSDAIAAVLLRTTLKSRHVEAHAFVPLANSDQIKDGMASVLSNLKDTADLSGAACIAAYPANAVSYRNIRVPFKEPKKIKQILPFELESELPSAIDTQLIDFQPFRFPETSANQPETDLIVATVETSALESYLDLMAQNRLDPDTISISSLTTALYLNQKESNQAENWILADIGNPQCTLVMVARGQVCYIRSFLTNVNGDGSTERLASNIRHSLFAMEEVLSQRYEPEFVWLTGHSSENLETNLAQQLNFPVHHLSIVDEAPVVIKDASTQTWSPQKMDKALSLALLETEGARTINLRQGELATQKFWAENKANILKTGFFAALVLIFFLVNFWVDFNGLRVRENKLDKQINAIFKQTFPDAAPVKDPRQEMWLKVEEMKKNSFFPEDMRGSIRAIDLVNEISRVISRKTDVKLTRLVIGPDGVTISGDTNDFNAVDDIKNRLENSGSFKTVTISSANTDKSGQRVRFKLKMQLKQS